jgi:hypothetical protein
LNENEWIHLAWTYDGSIFETYIDGQIDETESVNGLIDTYPTDITLGVRGGIDLGFFDGLIDEVRIWNVARTEVQIQQSMNQRLTGDEPGLAAYWNFDEGEGQMFMDFTGNGSNGFLGYSPEPDSADPVWVQSDAPIEGYPSSISNDSGRQLPGSVTLAQNYPNPFNKNTDIRFSLPKTSYVKLEIYDMLGRKVRTLIDRMLGLGTHLVSWNGKSDAGQLLSSGIYLYSIKAGDFEQTRKMLMLK